MLLALDDQKVLAEEEMKVTLDATGRVPRITKLMDPADANGEYIGATLIEARAAQALAEALEATWRRDPDLYYEDGYQTLVDGGGVAGVAPIGAQSWVEVDNHEDLARPGRSHASTSPDAARARCSSTSGRAPSDSPSCCPTGASPRTGTWP